MLYAVLLYIVYIIIIIYALFPEIDNDIFWRSKQLEVMSTQMCI